MRNGVAYSSWLYEVYEERSQGTGCCLRGGVAPVDVGIYHLAFKPPPEDECPADLGIKILECWSELAHCYRVRVRRYKSPNGAAMHSSIAGSASGSTFLPSERLQWGVTGRHLEEAPKAELYG